MTKPRVIRKPWTPGFGKLLRGISIPRPVVRSGWTTPKISWDPRKEIQTYDDLGRFGFFQDEWLRGGPVRRWVPKGLPADPVYTFETGGSTGVPKSRINIEDFRLDYEAFSDTLPDEFSRRAPTGSRWTNWSAPAAARRRAPGPISRRHLFHGRSRSALGDQAAQDGPTEDGRAVQATRRRPGADACCARTTTSVPVHHAEAARSAVREGLAQEDGITGVFCGGTEMTPQFHRFAVEELLDGAYFAPTYGNTLMGLAVTSRAIRKTTTRSSTIPPLPARDDRGGSDEPERLVEYGETGRVRLTTLTKEFFMPRFLERDEAEREPPCEPYPWDGVRNVRPFSKFRRLSSKGVY